MNIHTVADNLRKTIAGKEIHLAYIQKQINVQMQDLREEDRIERYANFVTKEVLQINIDELKRILQDVEVCIDNEDPGQRGF